MVVLALTTELMLEKPKKLVASRIAYEDLGGLGPEIRHIL
jgi:hypothetical protein